MIIPSQPSLSYPILAYPIIMNIYIEGNIGTGKTTFLAFLENNYIDIPLNIIYEPVDQWQAIKDKDGKNLLEHFYGDQDKWSFAFQMNSFISRVKKVEDVSREHPDRINIIERSVFTDRNCFAKNCYETGKLNEIEYLIYCRWHDWLCGEFNVKPMAFIYLKTEPEVSHQRIAKRERSGEASIPIDYLKLLHNLHEDWLADEANNVPVLTIDITENFYESEEKKQAILAKIKAFIEEL